MRPAGPWGLWFLKPTRPREFRQGFYALLGSKEVSEVVVRCTFFYYTPVWVVLVAIENTVLACLELSSIRAARRLLCAL